jgi:hypothetical protein
MEKNFSPKIIAFSFIHKGEKSGVKKLPPCNYPIKIFLIYIYHLKVIKNCPGASSYKNEL